VCVYVCTNGREYSRRWGVTGTVSDNSVFCICGFLLGAAALMHHLFESMVGALCYQPAHCNTLQHTATQLCKLCLAKQECICIAVPSNATMSVVPRVNACVHAAAMRHIKMCRSALQCVSLFSVLCCWPTVDSV